ncbi:MAG: gfo/Idh/MocA family oxidoreductase, partial [Verrucomicrobiaceae bacterium]
MTDPIGFAIIGTGMIANFHAEAIRNVPGAKLVAAFSRNKETCEAFAAQQNCRAVTSLDELVNDPTIHAACITTPSGAHADAAVPFLNAGKAVLCEKPLEVSLEAVDR